MRRNLCMKNRKSKTYNKIMSNKFLTPCFFFFWSSITTSLCHMKYFEFFFFLQYSVSLDSFDHINGKCKFRRIKMTISSIHSSSLRGQRHFSVVPMNWRRITINSMHENHLHSTDSRQRDSHFMFYHFTFLFSPFLFLTLTKTTLIDANERIRISL